VTARQDTLAEDGPAPLIQRIFAFMETTALMTAAKIGLPDALAGGPLTPAEVAARINVDEEAVARLLRDLTGTGVFATDGPDSYRLGKLGHFLRSDVPGSARAFYQMFGGPLGQGMIGGEASLLKPETTAFEQVMGAPIFEYMAEHPTDGTIFNSAMVSIGCAIGTPPIHAYDFSGLSQIVDVGGGHGQLAREVLRANPAMKGIVYDRPNVIGETQVEIERSGLADRCRAVAGDFFDSVPAGADCYALRLVIHDWNDEEATTILRHCRDGITGDGRLLIFEIVMPESDAPHPARAMDWVMLSCVTGQERTEKEYAALLERAGFRLSRVVPSPTPMSVVEAIPA
jgi:hypothetical protein